MKKIFVVLLVAFASVSGLFAQNVGDALNQADKEIANAGEQFPKGKWLDAKWDAMWVFGVNNTIQLKDAKTDEVIYTFGKAQRKDFKVNMTNAGLVITFSCDETHRTYKFTKPVTLSTDITMEIYNSDSGENYKVKMPNKN